MPEGIVIRAVAGFYDVADGPEVRRCRARGVFRKRGVTVLVGDRVAYDPVGLNEGVITAVRERYSQLVRPPVANVDQALLVFSLHAPEFHRTLLDRTLVAVQAAGIKPLIVVTKCDLGSADELTAAAEPYRQAGYSVIAVSARTGQGVDEVRAAVAGHVSVFVGPSGAGKSSLGNALSPELGLRMGEVSEKLGRGKHTTRHVELFRLTEDALIADAPGFSQLDIEVSPAELRLWFPEFTALADGCAYRGCLHVDEEECAVRAAVQDGRLAASRYESYRRLYAELRDKEEAKY